jgi:3-mercaptopyruvate sulfurtransferase SseA
VDWLVEQMASPGGVTVLDVRDPPKVQTVQPGLDKSIPGSTRARWGDFMNGEDLKSPEEIGAIYRAHGVSNDRPVVVYGGWSAENFWGEEGRVWWHLYWLNHTQAFVLYGGVWDWNDRIHKVRCSFTASVKSPHGSMARAQVALLQRAAD